MRTYRTARERSPTSIEGCDAEITPVVTAQQEIGEVRIPRWKDITEVERHEGPINEEVIVRPAHLPEECLEEGSQRGTVSTGAEAPAKRALCLPEHPGGNQVPPSERDDGQDEHLPRRGANGDSSGR